MNAPDPSPRYLTREQVREIDRRAIGEYGIPGIILMENAAIGAVEVAIDMLRGVDSPLVSIICGGGNNGGDGLAIARHLHNRDCRIEIHLAQPMAKYTHDADIQLRIVNAMKLNLTAPPDRAINPSSDLIIDALFGTGLSSPPRDPSWIDAINAAGRPILAIDLPSGMNCDTGEPMGYCVRATRTVSFVAQKAGFSHPQSAQWTGPVTVADIGAPRELIDAVARRQSSPIQ